MADLNLDVIDIPLLDAGPAWPSGGCPAWHRYDSPLEKKAVLRDWGAMVEGLRQHFAWLLTLDVGRHLGLPGRPVVPDATLWGAGLTEMVPGDFLSLHLDADSHPILGLERRANAVLFLGEWRPGWGGELEFCDAAGVAVRRVAPGPGRLVLWECTEDSYHRVAQIRCPPGWARRSLSVWWYGRPRGELKRPRARFVRAEGAPDDGLDGLRAGRAK